MTFEDFKFEKLEKSVFIQMQLKSGLVSHIDTTASA